MGKYKIGFTKHKGGGEYIASCGCGTVKLLGSLGWRELDRLTVRCEGCGNTNFVNLGSQNRVVYPHIEVLEKTRKGFKVKRTNLSVFHDDYYNVMIKENMVQVLIYDLVNQDIKLYKNGESVKITSFNREDVVRRFFTSVDDNKFKNMVSVEETRPLFNFAWDSLSRPKTRSWGGERKFWRGMLELFNGKYTYMQILSNAGFTNISRFYETRNYAINRDGTNPKDILGVPKFVLKYIRENENVGVFDIKQIKNALKKVDGNRFRELMEIVRDESTIQELCRTVDTLIEIHDEYKYNNLKKLTLYLFREIRMNQGIDSPSHGATLLRDYIRMATKLEQEYEKYPKSLKKEHDITLMNYNVQKNEMKKKDFQEAVESEDYKRLEYKRKDYSIVTPKEMQDLIKEGSELSHCIASYVQSVIDKRCQILFMRNTNDIDKPYVSIEVRNGNIRQVRGFANRATRKDEKDFIKEWASKKGLVEAYY